MHFALCRCAAAIFATAGASLIAVSLVASAAADPSNYVSYVANLGESQISAGSALFNQGDLIDGLEYVMNGDNNILVAAPEDALLASITSPDQPFYYSYFDSVSQIAPLPESFGQLSSNLQVFYDFGETYLNQGIADIAAGATNLGEDELFIGSNALTVDVAEQLLFGPLSIAFANLG